ncbi:MAG: helix-turn-helix transcriptional regulator, partial [Alistipes sp.]|nr:helix-turn-helix transcriptional regulator [Alistipes sp.]
MDSEGAKGLAKVVNVEAGGKVIAELHREVLKAPVEKVVTRGAKRTVMTDEGLKRESIDKICSELYISRAYLHKLFTATLGTSPMKYIKTKRLLAAREMIRIGEKPTNMYLKVKYNDYTTFFRAYRDFFGY